MPEFNVTVDQLREGVFIRLNLQWFEHPFMFSSFKITKPEQIKTLRELGIAEVTCVPEKSDVLPLPLQERAAAKQQPPPAPDDSERIKRLWEEKKKRIERLTQRRAKDEKCEQQFQKSVAEAKSVMKDIEAGSKEAFEESDRLLQSIAASLMPDRESAVQLMNTKFGKENVFYHSLNVAVLSMLLGKEYGLDGGMIKVLGIGALFHDIGKSRIPKSILHKSGPMTRAETNFYRLHPRYGVEILSKLEMVPDEAMAAVIQHHERFDGSGFPAGLKGKKASLFARIISIVNAYDNLCNKFDPKESLTPHEALAHMFGVQKHQFDEELLALFIQNLGVYPPGSIVKLSNSATGMVISVNPNAPLHPSIMIYNPEIPKKEALIYDLSEETQLTIEGSLKPAQLTEEVFEYLSPRTRVTYYVNEGDATHKGAAAKQR